MKREREHLVKQALSKLDKRPDGCWIWTGQVSGRGYGQASGWGSDGSYKKRPAHRFLYEYLVGPVDRKLDLDHLCRNQLCCNPAHLEPVDHRTNVLRGDGPSARNARKTHCKWGHPFDEVNTGWRRTGGRFCRECKRVRRAAARVAARSPEAVSD